MTDEPECGRSFMFVFTDGRIRQGICDRDPDHDGECSSFPMELEDAMTRVHTVDGDCDCE